MNVFLGWSKETSREIAGALRAWLPKVIQSVDAFVSTDDIDLGAAWNHTLAEALRNAHFGILCVTEENLTAPWLIFEAGALSISTRKAADTPHVTPILFDVERSKVASPIAQFQTMVFGKRGMWQLMTALNKVCESCGDRALGESDLKSVFEVWFPVLEKEISAILSAAASRKPAPAPSVPAGAPAVPQSTPENPTNAVADSDVKLYSYTEKPASLPAGTPQTPDTLPTSDSVKQNGFSDVAATDFETPLVSNSALASFAAALDRLHTAFGFIPDMARICVQGRQLVEQFQTGAPEAEKRKSLTTLQSLLEEDIRHMESDAGHGNPQRAERLELLKVLLHSLEHLP